MEYEPGLPDEVIETIESLLRASRSDIPENCVDTIIRAEIIDNEVNISASCLGVKRGKTINLQRDKDI